MLGVPIERLMGHAEPDAKGVTSQEAHQVFEERNQDPSPGQLASSRPMNGRFSAAPGYSLRTLATGREIEILRKVQELLDSPLGDSIGRIVEESYRLLPPLRAS